MRHGRSQTISCMARLSPESKILPCPQIPQPQDSLKDFPCPPHSQIPGDTTSLSSPSSASHILGRLLQRQTRNVAAIVSMPVLRYSPAASLIAARRRGCWLRLATTRKDAEHLPTHPPPVGGGVASSSQQSSQEGGKPGRWCQPAHDARKGTDLLTAPWRCRWGGIHPSSIPPLQPLPRARGRSTAEIPEPRRERRLYLHVL